MGVVDDPTKQVRFEARNQGDLHVLRVSGEIDIALRDQFAAAVDGAIDRAHSPLIVDLSAVQYMDSTGLSVLVAAYKRLAARGDALHVVLVQPLRRVFDVAALGTAFNLHESLDDAVGLVTSAAK